MATDNFKPIQVGGEFIDYDNLAVKFQDESGIAYGVKHIENKMRVSAMPYLYDIAEGNVPGHENWHNFGYSPAVGTGATDLWSKGGVYVFPGSAIQLSVFSSSAGDSSAGTGIRTVHIHYLDTSWAEKIATVSMNGTALVNTTETDIYRINAVQTSTVGTYGKSVGTISVTGTAGLVYYDHITPNFLMSRNSAYTVPAGKTLYIVGMHGAYGHSSNQPEYGRLLYYATVNNDGERSPGMFFGFGESMSDNTTIPIELTMPYKVPEKCDTIVSCIASAAGIANVALRGWLE